MLKTTSRIVALALAVAAAPLLYSGPAHAINYVWIRGCTITGVAEVDGQIQISIVKNGSVEWFSLATSNAMASRLLASASAVWLAGKKIDVKIDQDAPQGCNGQVNCETVVGWLAHN
jgi:hypothetical protein